MFVLGARKSRRLVGMEMSQISTPPSSCPAFANLWASSVYRPWSSASEVVFSAPVADVVAAVDPDRSRLECVTPFQPTQIMAAERDAPTSMPTVQLGDTGSGAVRTRSRSSAGKTSSRSTVR